MELADGFGSYLYIIFAVIYVVYSIIKAGKKVNQNRPSKQAPTTSPTTVQPPVSSPRPVSEEGDELKKMLEELLGGGSEEPVPHEQPRPKPVPVSAKPQPRPMPAPKAVSAKPVKPLVKKENNVAAKPAPQPAPHFVAHPEIVQKAFSESIVEEIPEQDFDLRQAVLYSEILKRPQY